MGLRKIGEFVTGFYKSVLITETDGHSSNDVAYLKYSDKNAVLKLNLSLEPKRTIRQKLANTLKGIFLPEGYPESVSQDYTEYQMWDTLQACASTITGTLSTKVILESVGVGKNEASAVSAAVTWNIKQSSGMLAGIVFAWLVSSGLDMNCKRWRLFADVVNDLAMCIELIVLPFFFDSALPILCVSTALKALVGVAGGATRAAITQHQAINQNMGDVSAKDGSQETCVNLISTFLGLGLISLVSDLRLTWGVFFVLTLLHIFANYRAVKCLNFKFFNEARLAIAVEEYLTNERVPSPDEANQKEPVFVLGRPKPTDDVPHCHLSFSLSSGKWLGSHRILVGRPLDVLTSPEVIATFQLQFLTHLYKNRNFIIFLNCRRDETMVGLSKDHSQRDLVEAYFHAICLTLAVKGAEKLIISKFLLEDEFELQFSSSLRFSISLSYRSPKIKIHRVIGIEIISIFC
ncbi:unnamed protein product [Nesidiocoris tenuis]|uniref:Uncharacterized protein n=1 Tax=Nesidiocoris tenuis TaxID=355587 RepID=A0A6H5GEB3_9HEMI|nr:unnamed protein product [Nesidiocoris tenuis]